MSNYPTYRSPIRTFQELGISTENIDPNQLRLERKRLLLEIQISETQTTQLAGKELSKNDVIQLFDELERVTHLNFHTAIFKHPILLPLLEDNIVVAVTIKKERKIFFDTQEEWDQFIAFISPYLANSIDKVLSKVIRTVHFKDLHKIQPFFKLLLPQDAFFAFRKFNNFCQTLENRLEILCLNQSSFPVAETGFLRYPEFYESVNEISRFYPSLPDSVASDVINFTVNSQRRVGRGKYLVEISDQARRLQCSAQLRTLIISNRSGFSSSKEEEASFNANFTWRMLVGLIIIGSFLFRATNRCESNRGRTFDSPNQELYDQIRSINRDGVITYRNDTQPGKVAEPKEFSFENLHQQVVRSTESSIYSENPDPSTGDPAIFSKLNAVDHGSTNTLTNETTSDMLMVVWADSNLFSYFIPALGTIEFSARNNSSIFFYSGTKWRNSRTVEFRYLVHSRKEVPIVRFNGYFSLWQEENSAFLRKLFTLTDGESNEFRITIQKGELEFYQGDRHVNYSF